MLEFGKGRRHGFNGTTLPEGPTIPARFKVSVPRFAPTSKAVSPGLSSRLANTIPDHSEHPWKAKWASTTSAIVDERRAPPNKALAFLNLQVVPSIRGEPSIVNA
jgi:hypothetical protein